MKAAVIGAKWVADFPENTAKAFQSVGVDTLFIPLYGKAQEPNLFETASRRWSNIKTTLRSYIKETFKDQHFINATLKEINHFEPDLVLLAGTGNSLTSNVLKELKKTKDYKIVQWLADPIDRFPFIYDNLKCCDRFYSANPFIAQDIKKLNICKTDYLPLACDPDTERTLSLSPHDMEFYGSDISFVGHIYQALTNRVDFFSSLINSGIDFSLKIWTLEARDLVKKYPQFSPYIQRHQVFGEKRVKVFNGSKINLNLHHEGMLGMGNVRFFGIPACGAFQLSNKKDQVPLFKPYLDLVAYTVFFKNVKELKELIHYYLKNERERKEMAIEAQKIVLKKHTYYHRVKQIIEDTGMKIM